MPHPSSHILRYNAQISGSEALLTAPHRFSFNGQERDDEVSGEGNSLSFKYRVEDSRLGRFFSVDPLYRSYPWNSNYSFCENQVTNSIELEGLESWPLAGTVSTVNGPYKNQNEAEKAARAGAPLNMPPVEIESQKINAWWRPKYEGPVYNPAKSLNESFDKFDKFMKEGGLGIWIRGAGSSSNPIPPSDRSYSKLIVIDVDMLDLAGQQFIMRNPISKTPFPITKPDATMQTKQWDFPTETDKWNNEPAQIKNEKTEIYSERGYWQNNSYTRYWVKVDTNISKEALNKGMKNGKFKEVEKVE